MKQFKSILLGFSLGSTYCNANFQYLGDGGCQNAAGRYYAGFTSPPQDSLITRDNFCLSYCTQFEHPNFAGIEVDRFDDQNTYCNCLFSGGLPNDVQLTDYNPAASNSNAAAFAVGPIERTDGDTLLSIVCYASATPPAVPSPTTSPVNAVQYTFTNLDDGYCLDSNGRYYAAFASPFQNNRPTNSFCQSYCTQFYHPNFVGVEVEDSRCYCLFSGGFPIDVRATDYNPPANPINNQGAFADGPVDRSDGDDFDNVQCFAAIVASPSSTPSPTAATTNLQLNKLGDGFCQNSAGQYYAGIVSPAFDRQSTADITCLSYCQQVEHPNFAGVEIDRFDAENTYCVCLYSGGIPDDVQLTDYNPAARNVNGNSVIAGPIQMADGNLLADVVCYARDVLPTTPSPTIVLPTNNDFAKVGDGYCLDSFGHFYSAVVSTPLASTNTDSYCQEWCLQVSKENLAGVEVYRFSLPHQYEVQDVYCACLYSGGVNDIEVTDFSPTADYSSTNMAVGTIESSDGDEDSVCYIRQSESPRPSANRVRLESTTGKPLQMFEFQVLSSGQNVALSGAATQSSTLNDSFRFQASNSIDNLNTTFSHTKADATEYWEVALDQTYEVEEISIINRFCGNQDDASGCLCRLSNAMITLYNNDEVVAMGQLGDTCGALVLSEGF